MGITRMRVDEITTRWRPGSADAKGDSDDPWTWADERQDIAARVCCCCDQPGHYQEQLVAKFVAEGEWWDEDESPMLGNDGRVWDGHHRIVAAVDLGIDELSVAVVD